MAWIEPVINRTLADVEDVKSLKERIYAVGWTGLDPEERKTFLGDMIGSLNSIMLNRIEGNTAELAGLLQSLGYLVPSLNYVVNWGVSSLPNIQEFIRILSNIEKLLDCSYSMKTKLPATLSKPDYQQINDTEKVLLELKDAIKLIIEGFRYCGGFNFYTGSEVVLP